MKENLENLLVKAFEQDKKKNSKHWINSWENLTKKESKVLPDLSDIPVDFSIFNSINDLPKWINLLSEHNFPDYFDEAEIQNYAKKSFQRDSHVFAKYHLPLNDKKYMDTIARYNAQDYIVPRLYPSPEKYTPSNVLDFSAGYGRQANLWTQLNPDSIYVGLDSFQGPYCLQYHYYKEMGVPFYEYFDPTDFLKIEENKKGIYHLPSWRIEILPSSFFDLIMCVQVLPLMQEGNAERLIQEFHRILKPGGMLYIRDHEINKIEKGKYRINNFLQTNGFTLEFRPHIIDTVDFNGIPRIFRKIDMDVVKSQTLKQIPKFFMERIDDIDSFLTGMMWKIRSRIVKKIIKRKGKKV
ncbi:MAG: hypothetical protein A3H98_06890 [Bacteroidetes bacterium RIFCSPLOWO2_02_FULL_36_8]|nr:MAG: hypothetical protein A3H98_06890 [Bacteroidetes bacterium RIFCSPLOWO2_02_FULL_36_8]OFY71627.1 MAG: hypothetical protein A3G23_01815 [Bacteroidetes bacterium RIFCSPLOWO2_12_FULL_37_12]